VSDRDENALGAEPDTVSALADVARMLESDGFSLLIEETETRLTVSVTAGPDACDECLVPKGVLSGIISSRLADASAAAGSSARELVIVYPTD
jgi:hypothetical protein